MMPSFIITGISSLYNCIIDIFWPNKELKRRRDSSQEDEENDDLDVYNTSSKRPKWADQSNMTTNNDGYSSPKRKWKTPLQKPKTRDNGCNTEVIEIEDDDDIIMAVKDRTPLSSLSIKEKTKSNISSARTHNSGHQAAQSFNNERRKNSILNAMYPENPTFTTSLRFSKYSAPRQTALNETLKLQDQATYSAVLAGFHRPKNRSLENHIHPSQHWHLESSIKKPTCSNGFTLRHDSKKSIHVPVKPWQSTSRCHDEDDDDIVIVETKCAHKVNSLEKKLAQNEIVSPQWILDMKKKYEEKERQAKRCLQETLLKKEIYAQHNELKRCQYLNERLRKHLQITDVELEDTFVEEVPVLPKLTQEIKATINNALRLGTDNQIIAEAFGQKIKKTDIKTLGNGNWLNDEVINFYMNLLIERGQEENKLKVYAFNTFFYPRLQSQGHSVIKRWTKKVDIFAHELVLVPIHLGMHWCMAAINFNDRAVRYYDSMGSDNKKCLNTLFKYINEESLDKKKIGYDMSGWTQENVKDIPQQMNGYDCGVFSCVYAEYLSRNAKFTFSQKEMPYFRQKMIYEIISKKLLT